MVASTSIRILLILMAVLGSANAYTWPSFSFWDSFETGDEYAWSSRTFATTNVTTLIVNTNCHGGSNCMAVIIQPTNASGLNGFLTSPNVPATNIYFTFWVNVTSSATPGAGGVILLAAISETGVGALSTVNLVRTGGGLYVLGGSKVANSTTQVSFDVWHCIQVSYLPTPSNVAWTVSMDGVTAISTNSTSITSGGNEVRLGVMSSQPILSQVGTILFDDITVSSNSIPYTTASLMMLNPDFNSRVGAKVTVIASGGVGGETFQAVLTNSLGLSTTVSSKAAPLNGRADFALSLSSLAVADYGLTCSILTNGTVEAQTAYTWSKTYAGNPNLAINEDNYFVLNGSKFFMVTPFCLNNTEVANWKTNLNMLLGMYFNDQTLNGWTNYLTNAVPSSFYSVGPINTGHTKKDGATPWTIADIDSWITNFTTFTNFAGYEFFDEPEGGNYLASDYRSWWDRVKLLDPIRVTHVNFMGDTFRTNISEFNNNRAHAYSCPWFVADWYGFDSYPVEYAATTDFSNMVQIAYDMRRWNYDMIPFTGYVQTCDARPGEGGGTPTAQQVKLMSWLLVIGGAAGVHWYLYQGTTPPDNFAAMAQFKSDIEGLTPIVCNPPGLCVETNNAPIAVTCRFIGNTHYLFAANMTSNSAGFNISSEVGAIQGTLNALDVQIFTNGFSSVITGGAVIRNAVLQ